VHPGSASTRGSWNPNTFHGWSGLPNNYVDAPPLGASPNYWYDFSSDSDLLLAGGFRAPQFTNGKPMVLLRGGIEQVGYPYAMAYWDRRLWLVNTQEPTKVAYSCDEAQCPLGVPEESFPPTNYLRIPSVDGRVIGMRTIGDMLLITTERWAYVIAGNNESNYRLMKVSAYMSGVGTYQMDEFPTSTGLEGEPTTVFYLGRDRIVYQWTVGREAKPISQPIQDSLDSRLTSLVAYQQSKVHCVSAWARRFVVVYPYSSPSVMYVYDIDNQIWSSSTPKDSVNFDPNPVGGSIAFTSVYGLNVPVNEIMAFSNSASGIVVRSWVRDDTAFASGDFALTTFPMNFDGKKTRKQIVAANIHASSGTWSLSVTTNESAATTTPLTAFAAYPDPLYSVYGPTPAPVDGAGSQDSVLMAGQFYANGAPIVGYRFQFYVTRTDAAPGRVYALDIGYIDMEEQAEGDV
jgi:hypothetical protein